MKVIRNSKAGTLTFVPVDRAERGILNQIIKVSKPGDVFGYDGRKSDPETGYTVALTFYANAKRKKVTKTTGNFTSISYKYVGGVKLELTASDEDSLKAIRSLRDAVYFSSGEITFIGSEPIEGKQSIIITVNRCQHCSANLVSRHTCEWKTCDACAAKCKHNYIHGVVHGGSAGNMAMGEFCDKCGRGKPEPEGAREKSQIERELQVERELGVTVVYKQGPIKSPRQAIKLLRTARRHKKANASK